LSLALLEQYQARFAPDTGKNEYGPDDTLASKTVAVYQDYWRAALTHFASSSEAERQLRSELSQLLSEEFPGYEPGKDVFDQLQQALTGQNLGYSLGQTTPWRDLYIWNRHTQRSFAVELTDRVEQVNVTLDFREFPGMTEAHMEYRAKLTELAFAGNRVSGLLRQFANNGVADSPSPHAAANFQVSHDIYREIFGQEVPQHPDPWQFLGPDRVGPAAIRLLQQDTQSLSK